MPWPGGVAQTIKPQSRRQVSNGYLGPDCMQGKRVFSPAAGARRRTEQAPGAVLPPQSQQVITVISVGIISQPEQEITYLPCGLPQALLLLPALPAAKSSRTQYCQQSDNHHSLNKRKAALFFHARSVAATREDDEMVLLILRKGADTVLRTSLCYSKTGRWGEKKPALGVPVREIVTV